MTRSIENVVPLLEYEVQVITGNSFGAGTDANVYIKVIGTRGSTAEHELGADSEDSFERGKSVLFNQYSLTRDRTLLSTSFSTISNRLTTLTNTLHRKLQYFRGKIHLEIGTLNPH